MSGQPVPSQLDQVLPQFYVQKAGPYHPFGKIRIAPFGKGGLRILAESGYNVDPLTMFMALESVLRSIVTDMGSPKDIGGFARFLRDHPDNFPMFSTVPISTVPTAVPPISV